MARRLVLLGQKGRPIASLRPYAAKSRIENRRSASFEACSIPQQRENLAPNAACSIEACYWKQVGIASFSPRPASTPGLLSERRRNEEAASTPLEAS